MLPPVGGRPVPPDERTSVMPAQDVWTGRAGVPARESAPMRDAAPPPGIEYGEGQRTWRAPLVIIGIALLLLALFAVAAWFALRGSGPAPVAEHLADPGPDHGRAHQRRAEPVGLRVAVTGGVGGDGAVEPGGPVAAGGDRRAERGWA